jgi:uncharacterized protein (DUF58 family)
MSEPRLAPPAARQGPGPMPAALIDSLAPAVDRLVTRMLTGDRRAAGVGLGTELAQLRPYAVGDDVRHLDAAASARTGAPHVRLHEPERALTTWIAVDVSPSMAFGTAQRLKADVAEGAALVFGRVAVRGAGRVGVVTFGSGAVRSHAPRSAQPGLMALRTALAAGVARDGARESGALTEALTRLLRVAREVGMIVVISDFRDQRGWEIALGGLRARQSVLAVEIADPGQRELPAVGRLTVVDPESGAQVRVNTSRRAVRRRFAELEAQRRERISDELRRRRVAHLRLSTDEDWLRQLGRQLGRQPR